MGRLSRSKVEQDGVLALRQEAGSWLRSLREAAGLSQRELAKAVGIEYYTFISQIESGRGRVPPSQIRAWAEALNVPPREMAIELMRYYDPHNHAILFGTEASAVTAKSNDTKSLEERIQKLESLLQSK